MVLFGSISYLVVLIGAICDSRKKTHHENIVKLKIYYTIINLLKHYFHFCSALTEIDDNRLNYLTPKLRKPPSVRRTPTTSATDDSLSYLDED